jgi:hypothetical protein
MTDNLADRSGDASPDRQIESPRSTLENLALTIPEATRQSARSEVMWLRAQIESLGAAPMVSERSQSVCAGEPLVIGLGLKPQISSVQQRLGQWVSEWEAAGGSGRMAERIQMFQVEIGKQLRLLALDALFLQTARQAATVEHRQQQVRTKIALLRQYCDGILALLDGQPE